MHDAVHQAISIINKRFDEPLTLESLATETFFSPFHFSRLFHKHAGMPPGGYLRTVRLFEAKRLLTTTSMTVANVVTAVGYSSVGTFTTRFTKATGLSPSQFRERSVAELIAAAGPGFHRLPSHERIRNVLANRPPTVSPTGSILGCVRLPAESTPADVLIGVFDQPVPQGSAVAWHALTDARTTEFFIHDVPIGSWFVLAMAMRHRDGTAPESFVVSANRCPITVTPSRTAAFELRLRPPRPTDPPIAVTIASPESRDECVPCAS